MRTQAFGSVRSVYKKLISRGLLTAVGRLLTVIALLGITALTARRFSHQEFGFWSVLLTMPFLAGSLCMLGINAGIGNRLAALFGGGEDGRAASLRVMQAGFLAQAALVVVCSVIGLALVIPVNWVRLLNIKDPEVAASSHWLMGVAILGTVCCQPFQNTYGAVLGAHHKIPLATLLFAGQNLILLIYTWLAFKLSFSIFVDAYFGINLGLVILTFFLVMRLVGWRLQCLPPAVVWESVRPILRSSMEFWVLTVTATMISSGQTILAAVLSGMGGAAEYSLFQRLFGLLITLHLAFLSPLSPTYTQRAAGGDWNWLSSRCNSVSFVQSPAFFLIVGGLITALHPVLLKLWTGTATQNYPLALLLLSGTVLTGMGNSVSMFLNSLGRFAPQAAIVLAAAVVYGFAIALISSHLGMLAIPVASILSAAAALAGLVVVYKGTVQNKIVKV